VARRDPTRPGSATGSARDAASTSDRVWGIEDASTTCGQRPWVAAMRRRRCRRQDEARSAGQGRAPGAARPTSRRAIAGAGARTRLTKPHLTPLAATGRAAAGDTNGRGSPR
jgi:hypothetical protein